MTVYTAPLEEIRFVLYDLLGAVTTLPELPGLAEHGRELIDAVLE
ncbi:MAG: Acyl-CoA dehydrogenase terminal [Rhodospirillales bacterium]|nr:Acyl-CoA dehydrogenase terminal [Rhodospirillales bacterium]